MKSLFGLDEKQASAVAYLGLFVTGIIFLVLEKSNKVVRFHAMQSTLVFIALGIVSWLVGLLFGGIPVIGWLLVQAIRLIIFASWVFLMYMAYKGTDFKVPVIGEVAWKQINK